MESSFKGEKNFRFPQGTSRIEVGFIPFIFILFFSVVSVVRIVGVQIPTILVEFCNKPNQDLELLVKNVLKHLSFLSF